MFLTSTRRKSSKSLHLRPANRENRENVDQPCSPFYGFLSRSTDPSTLHVDHLLPDLSPPSPPPRPSSSTVHNFSRRSTTQTSLLELIDLDTTDDPESVTCLDIDDLQDIDGEDDVVPIPFVDQEEAFNLLSFPVPPAGNSSASAVIVDPQPRQDPRLTLQMKSGPYYEVWDPRSSEQLSILGRIKYQPITFSTIASGISSSQLLWLCVEVYMKCPRQPVHRQTKEVMYLKIVEISEFVKPAIPLSSTAKTQHPDNVKVKLPQPLSHQSASSPIASFLSPGSTVNLQVDPIVWNQGAQVCLFKLSLPVADPFLFQDNGAGDVVRTMKVRSRVVVKENENGVVTVHELFAEEDIVVDVLKKAVIMDGKQYCII